MSTHTSWKEDKNCVWTIIAWAAPSFIPSAIILHCPLLTDWTRPAAALSSMSQPPATRPPPPRPETAHSAQPSLHITTTTIITIILHLTVGNSQQDVIVGGGVWTTQPGLMICWGDSQQSPGGYWSEADPSGISILAEVAPLPCLPPPLATFSGTKSAHFCTHN